MSTPSLTLPNSLNLSSHLSAQKYFFVCSLTVLAWDTLVLSPRSYRLLRTEGWPALKILYFFLQVWVLADFVPTGVMFYSTTVTPDDCLLFWPYEPICTAILLFAASTVHVIRITAIYAHSTRIRNVLLSLLFVQGVVTAICCGFYRSVHLLEGQGCIAGPLDNQSWVGIYWLAPTLFYGISCALAVLRSIQTLEGKQMTPWRLMLRDSLNLYGTILFVNLANVLFYFIMPPTDYTDPIKTIVTSMAAVLTTTMSMRIILAVKGRLEGGGSFSGSGTGGASSATSGSLSTGIGVGVTRPRSAPTYTIGDIHTSKIPSPGRGLGKDGVTWDDKHSVDGPVGGDAKAVLPIADEGDNGVGVQITVDKQIDYDEMPRKK
ncbi:hypothetical protein F5I97DRAFT_1321609 [Phlebopus sp. FC_14]|nr:hypothetical protein F5I97DRAFT_1321609 [Phlebopus sp. FC_14]